MRRRIAHDLIDEATTDTPVILLHGARQTGKTTLARWFSARRDPSWDYVTFDDAAVLAAAKENPPAFIRGFDGSVVLDEVQRAPEIFSAIKLVVDEDRRPGRFLLTGSANVLLLPKLSESLAGRMEIIPVWPFAAVEADDDIDATTSDEPLRLTPNFVDAVFASSRPSRVVVDNHDLTARVLRGGYPEMMERTSPRRRRRWFSSYITTILQRDVREISNVENLAAMPKLMALLASRTGGLLNMSDLSRGLSIPVTTLKRYVALLETTFLLRTLPAWSSNLGLRLTKSPKTYLVDTGLAAHLLQTSRDRLGRDGRLRGALVENYVVMELTKLAGWSDVAPDLFHFRTTAGQEVDVVMEGDDGRLVGIEIKASSVVSGGDFKGLRRLRELVSKRFIRGIVLYDGRETVSFDDDLIAMPIGALWKQAKPSSPR